MKKLLLLCVLAVAVGGCSPSEKSIQKAVEKGDYLYVEKYLSNPKYWNDPNKYATNTVAVEALILLNRIDSAVNIYKENKEDRSAEGRIVNAFANGLKKSTIQKVPEKIMELIDDERNNASDALLIKTAVEIEPSLSVSKIKTYIAHSKENRNSDVSSAITYIKKATAWGEKGIIEPSLKSLYSDLSSLNSQKLTSEKERAKVLSLKKELDDINPDRVLYQSVYAKLRGENIDHYQKKYDDARHARYLKYEELDSFPKIEDIEKAIAECEAKIKTKFQEAEAAENQLIEKLNAAAK